MKRLIIMRHATTPDGSPDHTRPLSAHGQAEALSVARQLAALAWIPQKIWCSDATRTTQTCQQLLSVFPALASSTAFERALYNASPQTFLGPLSFPTTAPLHTLLLLGHNPAVTYAAAALSAQPALAMSPAFAALLQRDDDTWTPDAGAWQLVAVLKPAV
jgi:phosphohistidine phosphatase